MQECNRTQRFHPRLGMEKPGDRTDGKCRLEESRKPQYSSAQASCSPLRATHRESTYFATKQAKSHKCRIWCRLRGIARCNQPLELD
jgi:hypothetical protein